MFRGNKRCPFGFRLLAPATHSRFSSPRRPRARHSLVPGREWPATSSSTSARRPSGTPSVRPLKRLLTGRESEPHRSGRFRLAPAAGRLPPVEIPADRLSGVRDEPPPRAGGSLLHHFLRESRVLGSRTRWRTPVQRTGYRAQLNGRLDPANRCCCPATSRIPGSG